MRHAPTRPLRTLVAGVVSTSLVLAATATASSADPDATGGGDELDVAGDTTDPDVGVAPPLPELAERRAEREQAGLRAVDVADEPEELVVADGVTQPAFSYAGAVRETVTVEGAVDSDDAGELDRIHVDIIRPAASDEGLDVPTIIVPSPYYAGPGRGRAGETKAATTGPLDAFPLYYDNYFVPRGYAVAFVDLAGTRNSTGCLDIGGPAEIDNTAKVVEWLAGVDGALAWDGEGDEVTADWSNGLSAMVGKSWDGTVANGVAALGTEGLATIVPITAISSWHRYYWNNGVRYGGTPLNLADNIRNAPAENCERVRDELRDGGEDPDPTTDFWQERDYELDAANVEASVFVVHGTNDYNVKPDNYGPWWDELAAHDVTRRIWLAQVGHEKAFDFDRDAWLTSVHRWFDHELQGIDNGALDEPMAYVEHAPNEFTSYDTWPGGTPTTMYLGAGDDGPSTLSTTPASDDAEGTVTFTETHQQRDAAAVDGDTEVRSDRVAFLTDELPVDVRVSGTSEVTLQVEVDGTNASFSAYLVDYGTAERVHWGSGGGLTDLESFSCFGSGTSADTGCYRDVERILHTRPFEVVARGWANTQFVTGEDSLDADETYEVSWDIFADDYVFRAGHRLGVVISGVDTSATRNPGTSSEVTIHLDDSHVELPIVGGADALEPEPEEPAPTLPTCDATGTSFPDVPAGSVHADAIGCLSALEIIRGRTDGTFAPRDATRRDQAASMIARLLEAYDVELPTGDGFGDVPAASPHADSVAALAELGIIEGRADGRFVPDGQLSRAQTASILARTLTVLGAPLEDGPDAFDDDDGSVHERNIDAGAAAGLIEGRGDRVFAPNGDVRRDQLASFLARTIEHLAG
ncbi:hypothetical protein FTX61_00820 [Nitriliruptoraceae bacterium ZYF776]|nr:hypothetical protein [Profundirhabdus halotolerans]